MSPDGRRLACGAGRSGEIHIWDLEAKVVEYQYSDLHSAQVVAVRFVDSERLVSGGQNGNIKLWNLDDGSVIDEFDELPDYTPQIAMTDDGRHVVAGAENGQATVVTIIGDELKETVRLPEFFGVESVDISSDGDRVVAGNNRGAVVVWDARSGRGVGRLVAKRGFAHYREIGPDESEKFAPKTVPYYFDREGFHELEAENSDIFEMTRHSRGMAVTWSPDGKLIAAAVGTQVRVWDAASGERLHTFDEDEFRVCAVAFSSDSKSLAAGGWDRIIRIWDVKTGNNVLELKVADWPVGKQITQLAFLSDNRKLISSIHARPAQVSLWDIDRKTIIGEGFCGGYTEFDISADEKRLVAYASRGLGTAQLWSLPDLTLIKRLDFALVSKAIFHPGKPHLLIGNSESTRRVDLRDGSVSPRRTANAYESGGRYLTRRQDIDARNP